MGNNTVRESIKECARGSLIRSRNIESQNRKRSWMLKRKAVEAWKGDRTAGVSFVVLLSSVR